MLLTLSMVMKHHWHGRIFNIEEEYAATPKSGEQVMDLASWLHVFLNRHYSDDFVFPGHYKKRLLNISLAFIFE